MVAFTEVGHADDVQHQFVFGEIEDSGVVIKQSSEQKSEDVTFSKNFVKLWASFAIHG